MAEKLLECPFCGSDAKYNEKLEAVFCHGCDAMRTGYKYKKGSAISEWNRRPQIKEAQNTIDNTAMLQLLSSLKNMIDTTDGITITKDMDFYDKLNAVIAQQRRVQHEIYNTRRRKK